MARTAKQVASQLKDTSPARRPWAIKTVDASVYWGVRAKGSGTHQAKLIPGKRAPIQVTQRRVAGTAYDIETRRAKKK